MTATPASSRPLTREIRRGAELSVAAGLGLIPLGVAFGVIVVQAGLPWWMAPALSFTVYAGSVEFLVVTLLVAATPISTIALTAFLVNFRHVFYAFSFPRHVMTHPLARLYSTYALTDEAFAIAVSHPHHWSQARLLTTQIVLQAYWVGGGLLGVAFAAIIPSSIRGIEFAMVALFIVLALDAAQTRHQVPSVILGGLSYAVAALLFSEQRLFAALLMFVGTLVVRFIVTRGGISGRAPNINATSGADVAAILDEAEPPESTAPTPLAAASGTIPAAPPSAASTPSRDPQNSPRDPQEARP